MHSIKILFWTMLATLSISQKTMSQLLEAPVAGISIAERYLYLESDTIPRVIYKNAKTPSSKARYFVNEEPIPEQAIATLDPQSIASMKVEKDTKESTGVNLKGSIFITLKDEYDPTFINLSNLKIKHTKLRDEVVIFMLNNEVIHSDPTTFLVNEKFILNIEVNKINNFVGLPDLYLINLVTRTKENLEKSNVIYIK